MDMMQTQGNMIYEWDENKEKINKRKHGLSFSTALKVFADEKRVELFDEKHSGEEDRYMTIGEIGNALLVVTVIYTERKDVIRLISARKATKEERRLYYDN